MRGMVCAVVLAASALALPAAAETAAGHAPGFSVQTTQIAEILKSDQAKAVLEREVPGLKPFYGRISDLTLAQVAGASHGLLGQSKLKAVQAGFDNIR